MAATLEGLNVVLTPIQLAAVLGGDSLGAHELLVNRLWGGGKVIGGALELVAGGALFLTPEPTLLTKAGGSVLLAHGVDTFTSGVRDVWTGESHKTLTQQAGEQVAYSVGANPAQAERTGIVLDVAVPLLVAATTAALRIVSIRAGRVVLAEQEALGGHTLLKHIGKTEGELRARLVLEPRIPAAGSFPSLRVAEAVLSDALKAEAPKIHAWATGPRIGNYVFSYRAGRDIVGFVIQSRGRQEFPHLDQLLGGYFHQDMSMHGDTVEDIVSAFRVDSDPLYWRTVREDIHRFLAQPEDDEQLTQDFLRTFHPDLIERPWGLTIRQFLQRVDQLLTEPIAIPPSVPPDGVSR